ncbi:BEN domain-containing protein 5-like isoform X1 [Dermacentor variabilis]|uniref:BEN domain-containing protein 5-like isoform X1 n=1 Tax=Dermacentor variabilis TaxID=34621 RepID=UPI003F5B23A4
MFACVRFVEEIGNNQLYIIPVKDIISFNPKDESDFDNRSTYNAYWRDPSDKENSGEYVVQILKLAASKKEMQRQLELKRPQIPKLNPSDVDSEGEEEQATRKTARQELQKQKQTKAAARKQQYTSILSRYTQHIAENVADANKAERAKLPTSGSGAALEKSTIVQKKSKHSAAPAGKKMAKLAARESESSSDSDEALIPASQLRSAMKEIRYWKMLFKQEQKNNAALKEQVGFLQTKVVSQLTCFQETLDTIRKEARAESSMQVPPLQGPPQCDAQDTCITTEEPGCPDELGVPSGETPEHVAAGPENSSQECALPSYTATPDGRFHLCNNIFITTAQAAKLFSNKKPSILVREAAQVIWGIETLAQRSISGRLGPTRHGEGEPCKQLTPEKLDAVFACLSHWGKKKNVDTSVASGKVLRVLSEKIQDVKKKLRI